ncbi:hypothetical protein [uncultured Rikenella sp.]|uniref:hypothetical protein n=1 Tax=uncultured Rikenella sp. TaxID=368003 RepID=UPI0025E4BCCF|nr:hypothetical protein [uncultured Rikenella sp.]
MPLGINGCRSAPGFRAFDEGALWHVGNRGFVWSSAPSNIYGLDLSFSPSWLFSNGSDYRAHCFPLRCLSE